MGDEEGKISNYGFTGDYVFGLNGIEFNKFSSELQRISEESDHEMVFGCYKFRDKFKHLIHDTAEEDAIGEKAVDKATATAKG